MKKSQEKNIQGKELSSQIGRYVNKYWVNQETFKELLSKQEKLELKQSKLPSPELVIALIILIEFSLAYMIVIEKEEKKTKKQEEDSKEEVINKLFKVKEMALVDKEPLITFKSIKESGEKLNTRTERTIKKSVNKIINKGLEAQLSLL